MVSQLSIPGKFGPFGGFLFYDNIKILFKLKNTNTLHEIKNTKLAEEVSEILALWYTI